jgi:hypothetical protein
MQRQDRGAQASGGDRAEGLSTDCRKLTWEAGLGRRDKRQSRAFSVTRKLTRDEASRFAPRGQRLAANVSPTPERAAPRPGQGDNHCVHPHHTVILKPRLALIGDWRGHALMTELTSAARKNGNVG